MCFFVCFFLSIANTNDFFFILFSLSSPFLCEFFEFNSKQIVCESIFEFIKLIVAVVCWLLFWKKHTFLKKKNSFLEHKWTESNL